MLGDSLKMVLAPRTETVLLAAATLALPSEAGVAAAGVAATGAAGAAAKVVSCSDTEVNFSENFNDVNPCAILLRFGTAHCRTMLASF